MRPRALEDELVVNSMLPWMGWSGPVNLALSQATCVELRRIGMGVGDGGVTLQQLLARLFADRPDLRPDDVNCRLASAMLKPDGEHIWTLQRRRGGGAKSLPESD